MQVAGAEEEFQNWYEKLDNFIQDESLDEDLKEKIPSLTWFIIERKINDLKNMSAYYEKEKQEDKLKLLKFILSEMGY